MPRHAVVVALLALLGALSLACASEDTGHISILTSSNYEDSTGDGKVNFVKYFAPWCGHCKRLAPTWKELADEFHGSDTIRIAQVDCTTDRDVCTAADVKGYPTLKVVHKGEEVKAYRGARELDALKAFIKETADELLTETTE